MGRLLFGIICFLSVLSCKDETTMDVVGVWESSSLIADKFVDLNGDRNITRNLYEESTCAFERITFNANQTIVIENNELGIESCDVVNTFHGTWEYVENPTTLVIKLDDYLGEPVIDTVRILDNVTIRCYHSKQTLLDSGVTVTYKDQKRKQ